ncbi:GNAT family N-acetyltransferase [Autumnicola edwardsiae]|uniref:GNAT family N-acetyltransferase n=1 Tax=Autumnicola edwardsiae TaxID=3075594 RepID=A0ABU3CRV4_9FLAO|nr:GNAT family N-acetyltransferase [Zunongwangia sp. F297]MDT0649087.1 GNAT family N-acetyltransferase [Zunongwangia sp. F297]
MSTKIFYDYPDFPSSFWAKNADLLFHSKNWIEVLNRTYSLQIIMAQDEGSEEFLLFGLVDNPFEKKLISLPFSDYSGEDNLSNSSAFEIIEALQKKFPAFNIVFKSRFYSFNLSASEEKKPTRSAFYHRILIKDLKPNQIKNNQSSSFHRGVRKALKEEVSVQKTCAKEDIEEFYDLYANLRLEKFGIIPQPFCFFKNIWELFLLEEKGFLLKAVYKNKTIASIFILEHKNKWYYKFGASAKDHLKKRPNNLLFYKLVELAEEEQVEFIDLGMSGSGKNYEGLRRFKEEMGGHLFPINVYEFDALQPDEIEKEDKKVLEKFTSLIVSEKPPLKKVSELSEFLYPFFV